MCTYDYTYTYEYIYGNVNICALSLSQNIYIASYYLIQKSVFHGSTKRRVGQAYG